MKHKALITKFATLFMSLGMLFTGAACSDGNNNQNSGDGIVFADKTITYDGNYHTIEAENVPENATITYQNQGPYKNVGDYSISAIVTTDSTNVSYHNAWLHITKAEFKNLVFNDTTIDYDGQKHSITVTGVPSDASVTYTSDVAGVTNAATDVGTYHITATVIGSNYITKTLSATLTINASSTKQKFTGIVFNSTEVTYDGQGHTITASGYPSGTTVTYTNAGPHVAVGTYTISVTLSKDGYETLTKTAVLTIKEKNTASDNKEGTYVKVTESTDDWTGVYLFTYNDEIALDGSLSTIDTNGNYVDIIPTNNEIDVGEDLAKSAFTVEQISGGYSIKKDDGNYIYCGSTKNKLNSGSTAKACTFAYNNGNVNISESSRTLKYYYASDNQRFRFYQTNSTSAKSIQAYRLEDTTPKPLTGLSFSSSSYEVEINKTLTLNPVKTPSRATSTYTWASSNTNIATVADGIVTAKGIGQTTITATSIEYPTISASVTVNVVDKITVNKTELQYDYNDYYDNYAYSGSSITSEGASKLLVIPIWFTDSASKITKTKDQIRTDIQKAYFGSTTETGWHSVKSFYEAESFGKVSITGTVASWYECNKTMATVGGDDGYATITTQLVNDAVDDYFDNNPTDSRTNYDLDKDGYLDGICCIYAAPDYYTGNLDEDSYSNLWAYCYWCDDENSTASTTNPIASVFFWASYDFMYADTSHCNIDAHTYIHEAGHMFGLDDYYDYNSYCESDYQTNDAYSPAGDSTMQDNNVGGHDPFSVMALGWASPYIPTSTCTVEIGDFQTTHDLILLSPDGTNSPFDEYILLELYTTSGLNNLDATYAYDTRNKLPTNVGIRAWHVDARLAQTTGYSYTSGFTFSSTLTTTPTLIQGSDGYSYGTMLACSNTHYIGDDNSNDAYSSELGKPYYNYKLLKLLRAGDTTSSYSKVFGCMSNSDLFTAGKTFTMSTYKNQFYNSGKLDSGKDLGWSFTVDSISGTGSSAKATITCSKA